MKIFPLVLIVGGFMFLSAFVLTRLVIRLNIQDLPNERSNHDRPIPKSGGIAFMVPVFTLALALLFQDGHYLISQIGLEPEQWAIFIGLISVVFLSALADDIWELSPLIKFVAQFVAGLGFVIWVAHAQSISVPGLGVFQLGVAGYGLTVLWIMFFMNAYNFMDGINGIAGGTAVIASLFFAVIAFQDGATGLALLSFGLGFAILGYLPYNFPKAQIFMGDTGSQSVGFLLASFCVLGASNEAYKIPLFIMPLLFFPFLFDVFLTLFRRARKGKKVWHAHREHIYQLCIKIGCGHATVSLAYFALFLVCGAAAYGFSITPNIHMVFGLIILAGLGTAMAYVVFDTAHKHNVLD